MTPLIAAASSPLEGALTATALLVLTAVCAATAKYLDRKDQS